MDPVRLAGIACGFGAATAMSITYVFSRLFVQQEGRTPFQLLALGHIIMGVLSLIILPFVYEPPVASWGRTAVFMVGVAGFYTFAQGLLFVVLKRSAASNISPLLGVKIAVAAVVGIALGNPLTPLQWLAVGLVVLAALLLRDSKEGVTLKLIGMVLFFCALYTGSDYSIQYLVACLGEQPTVRTVILAVALSYTLCGLLVLVFFRDIRRSNIKDWIAASGFAIPWYISMFCLFGAFSTIGVVFGVILQSTRGVISVLVAIVFGAMGIHVGEEKAPLKTRLRQLTAACLMVAAIVLFQYFGGE